ncbi:hypothetical protein QVD17_25075 [Tagetes erecta]|uniref:Uncharacterized protein n=1 Tax=Tagetes erecta TaxID=13708 RepID=A0AAD8KGB3_TARER|nr:hypothetical protein QVD17_25075 [Tagetes erecta]
MPHLFSPIFFLNFIIIFTNFCFHTNSITHWEDIQSLKQFRNGVDSTSISPGSCLSSWNFTLDPCDSLSGEQFTCGIRCDVVISNVSRITDLTLDRAGYSGSLGSGSSSWNLPYLQTLDLTNNYFTGSIPGSFSKLTRLQRLSLSTNSLNGSIPDSLPDSLEELYLDNNNLHGVIPNSLNRLKNLKRLELQGNQLTNSFPELTQLSNLYFLDVSNNQISGELPAGFPPNLISLAMRNNSISGDIVQTNLINNTLYLQVLDLSYNNLTGDIPAELFTHPSLQQLTLANNQFRRVKTPANWEQNINKSELIAIDLSDNNIHGFLPGFMGYMPKLSALSLERNKFSGEIPTQYAVKTVVDDGEMGRFERLLLGGNYLYGLIPGPFLRVKSGSGSVIGLGDNCLYECVASFWFCEGGVQKSVVECKRFGGVN